VNETAGKGVEAILEGSTLLCGSRSLLMDAGIVLEEGQTGNYGTEVLLAVNGNYAGCLVIADTVKEDAKPAVQAMKRQGIVTAMLTGDAAEAAQAVAAETGIDEVHAKLLPEQKLQELTRIRSAHGSVMFVGDGINDAPVLAGADVGAAMGSGADAAIEAADVVFMTSSMSAIPQALSIAKATGRIARQNVIFALAVKAAVMVLGLAGLANMWMAVFADTGVAMLCIINSIRILYKNKNRIF
jgi:Cd2+/Zn2+-exporting ATPase